MKSITKPELILLPGLDPIDAKSIPVLGSLVEALRVNYTGIAFILTTSRFCWFEEGWLHRTDGPAMYNLITKDKHFYLRGKLFSSEDWFDNLTSEQQEQAIWKMNIWR